MNFRLSFIACLLTGAVFGQEKLFLGTITDKDTKVGIPFCLIKAKDRNQGVYTDENGRFSFTANTDSVKTLLFYCLGYAKRELPAALMPNDSAIIELTKEYSRLSDVVITGKTGKQRTTYIGKKKSKHTGDCYQTYGEEVAAFLKADPARQGTLKDISVYITNEGAPASKFRIHVYTKDPVTNMPSAELTDTNLIVHAEKGNEWVKADVSNRNIPVNDGVFISVEWISGFGNTDVALQSAKHTEVNAHNGQVLGLTKNSWKGKGSIRYIGHRDAFNTDWSSSFSHSFSPAICPMIYGTYTYYKN